MPIAALPWIIGALGIGGGIGAGAYKMQSETGEGIGDALRMAAPIIAVGFALYLYQRGAR